MNENEISMQILSEKSEIQTWICLFLTSLKFAFQLHLTENGQEVVFKLSPYYNDSTWTGSKVLPQNKSGNVTGVSNLQIQDTILGPPQRPQLQPRNGTTGLNLAPARQRAPRQIGRAHV